MYIIYCTRLLPFQKQATGKLSFLVGIPMNLSLAVLLEGKHPNTYDILWYYEYVLIYKAFKKFQCPDSELNASLKHISADTELVVLSQTLSALVEVLILSIL